MKTTTLKINDKKYKVLIAESEEDKNRGLKGVTKLPEGKGMLFVWNKPLEVSMTMGGTLIPLDLIFIDEDGEVIAVENRTDTELDLLVTHDNTKYVLEINPLESITPGDLIECELFDSKEDDNKSLPTMKVLAPDGSVLYELQGGERIFSRISTKKLIKWAKRSYNSHKDSDYKRLGITIFKELKAQDSRDPEYIEAPK